MNSSFETAFTVMDHINYQQVFQHFKYDQRRRLFCAELR